MIEATILNNCKYIQRFKNNQGQIASLANIFAQEN